MVRVGWLVVVLVGCGDAMFPDAGAALSLGGDTGDDEELTHGFIRVQFARAESAPDTPYVGTDRIEITMTYDSCFTTFYDGHPNWTVEGADGAPVFGTVDDGGEGWTDRLCAPRDNGQATCTIAGFQQELDITNALTVTYAVEDNPENHFVKFGPLPLIEEIPEFVCEFGWPRMQIDPQQMRGYDSGGAVIWQGEALDQDMASPGQAKAVVVKSARR